MSREHRPPPFPPRPRIVRPEFSASEIPTADDAPHSTYRPPKVEQKTELEELLGGLMASQSRLEASWAVRSREHETTMREVTALSIEVREMREELRRAGKKATNMAKLAPAVIALIELARAVLTHYLAG